MGNDELWGQAVLIRRFEQELLELFGKGHLHGTVHTCIGQEWVGIAVGKALQEGDIVFSNHRGHGHFIACGGEPLELLAEIMGKSTGVCAGIGGSQHLLGEHLVSNGIQGGLTPIAVGAALARKMAGEESIAVAFVGDGTFGQGVLYESLNIASNWDLPLLMIVENNRIAQSTPSSSTLAGSIEGRARAMQIDYRTGTTRAPEELVQDVGEACAWVREQARPLLYEVATDRLMAHSKSDDTRAPEFLAELASQDVLTQRLEAGELAAEDASARVHIEAIVIEAMEQSCLATESLPTPSYPRRERAPRWVNLKVEESANIRFGERLNRYFHRLMEDDARVVMLGEDIESPYGGAFKITKGLSESFPSRVRNTPISEAAIVGVGTGLALSGYRPFIEIMFGDFLSLCMDQLLNHACKFEFMFNGRLQVPLVVRTPMGGHRGYGPTHSQCIEKYFLGIPYLTVAALNYRLDPGLVYDGLVREHSHHPALMIENKVDYTRRMSGETVPGFRAFMTDAPLPTLRISPEGVPADVTVACYGGTLHMVEQAIETAFQEHDIVCEVICPTLVHPTDVEAVAESVAASGRLLTVEEGPGFAAWGSELIASLAERGTAPRVFGRVASNSFVPTSKGLEEAVLPNSQDVVSDVMRIMGV